MELIIYLVELKCGGTSVYRVFSEMPSIKELKEFLEETLPNLDLNNNIKLRIKPVKVEIELEMKGEED